MRSIHARWSLAVAVVLAAGCAGQTALAPIQSGTPPAAGLLHGRLAAPSGAQAVPYALQALYTSPHLLGAAFLDATSASCVTKTSPILAYNSQDDTYLAVWNQNDGSGGDRVRARIKDSQGQTQVPDFTIAAIGDVKTNGKAVYLPWLNQFAVAYQHNTSNDAFGTDIYVQRISDSGALIGAAIPVSTAREMQRYPDLAVDPINHRLEVVWQDRRSGDYDIYGRLLGFNGNQTVFLTNELLLGNSPPDPDHGYRTADQTAPTIAFGTQQQTYVVVWEDARSADNDAIDAGEDLYATTLGATGMPVTSNFVVSNLAGDQKDPSIAYLAASDKFLVAFTSANNGDTDTDLLAAGLDGDGTVLGWGVLDDNLGNQHRPNVAANDASLTWLVGFLEDFNNQEAEGDSRVLGRHVGWAFQLGDVFNVSPLQPDFLDSIGIAANTDDQEFLMDYTQPTNPETECTAPDAVVPDLPNASCTTFYFGVNVYGQRVDRGY
ncbi:MAG TPA: hypothetical protein V6D47_04365 [Oscillatoriaceae cyanobacterium]